jgi:hypothetical protein
LLSFSPSLFFSLSLSLPLCFFLSLYLSLFPARAATDISTFESRSSSLFQPEKSEKISNEKEKKERKTLSSFSLSLSLPSFSLSPSLSLSLLSLWVSLSLSQSLPVLSHFYSLCLAVFALSTRPTGVLIELLRLHDEVVVLGIDLSGPICTLHKVGIHLSQQVTSA